MDYHDFFTLMCFCGQNRQGQSKMKKKINLRSVQKKDINLILQILVNLTIKIGMHNNIRIKGRRRNFRFLRIITSMDEGLF